MIDGGTGAAANIGRPAAGKTGSSQYNANAWFVGYTPTLSTAVWMGKTDGQGPAQALLRIKGVPRVYGGTIPARTWKAFMTEALKDVPVTDFNEPAPITSIADRLRRERSARDSTRAPAANVRDVTRARNTSSTSRAAGGDRTDYHHHLDDAARPTTADGDGGGGGPFPFP